MPYCYYVVWRGTPTDDKPCPGVNQGKRRGVTKAAGKPRRKR
jgi:hypothetical protein